MLRDVAGLSTHEVAEALDVSEEVVKSRLHRARVALRARLESESDAGAREIFGFHARAVIVVAAVRAQLRD
jgi:RNA polymerase sigma-70 factor (ECF subfamily)